MSALKRETLAFTNPNNKARVIKKLDALLGEWRSWEKEVAEIRDHPYNRMIQTDVYADGGFAQECRFCTKTAILLKISALRRALRRIAILIENSHF
jgi:hypothetical protein